MSTRANIILRKEGQKEEHYYHVHHDGYFDDVTDYIKGAVEQVREDLGVNHPRFFHYLTLAIPDGEWMFASDDLYHDYAELYEVIFYNPSKIEVQEMKNERRKLEI